MTPKPTPAAVVHGSGPPKISRPLRAILWGGLACGVLDLAFALIFFPFWRGATVMGVLQAIASGLLGATAQRGGSGTAALGVALHFLISFGAATVYFLASRRIRFLRDCPLLAGLLYGLVVYFVMQAVVLPLSAAPNAHFPPQFTVKVIPAILAHVFLVGPPIAFAVRRWA